VDSHSVSPLMGLSLRAPSRRIVKKLLRTLDVEFGTADQVRTRQEETAPRRYTEGRSLQISPPSKARSQLCLCPRFMETGGSPRSTLSIGRCEPRRRLRVLDQRACKVSGRFCVLSDVELCQLRAVARCGDDAASPSRRGETQRDELHENPPKRSEANRRGGRENRSKP
jgi:hypothetical protein